MTSTFSVQAALSPMAGCSTVLTSEDRAHISQNTPCKSSTFSGVRAATSVPSSAPAVLAAKTAATSPPVRSLALDLHAVIAAPGLEFLQPVRQLYVDLGDGGAEGYGIPGRLIGEQNAEGGGQQRTDEQHHSQSQHQHRAAHQGGQGADHGGRSLYRYCHRPFGEIGGGFGGFPGPLRHALLGSGPGPPARQLCGLFPGGPARRPEGLAASGLFYLLAGLGDKRAAGRLFSCPGGALEPLLDRRRAGKWI